jgi:hydroxypyruvate isomerase
MPKFAANLSFLYQDLAFLDRFEAAAKDGFEAVEYLFPYEWPAEQLAEQLKTHKLVQVLFNAPPGHWEQAERGLAALPGREAEFQAGLHKALAYAKVLGCPRIHVMAGLVPTAADVQVMQATYERNLAWAAAQAAPFGVDVLIEPINTRDIPGYFLNRQAHAHQVCEAVGAANLKVQMDLYHCQIVEGDVAMKLRQYVPSGRVGHIQIASVPERNEPDGGELNYRYLFDVIDELGFEGWLGCEYRPRGGSVPGASSAGLGWFQPYGRSR